MSDYTLEDLLKILEEGAPEKESPIPTSDSKISSFINEYKITHGVDRIPTYMVYYTYKEIYGGELSKVEFFRQFNKDFIQVRTGKQRSYLLDGESFDRSREGIIKAEFYSKGKK